MRAKPVPSKSQFKESFGVGRFSRSLPKGAMHRISKLLEIHDNSMLPRSSTGRMQLLADIEMQSSFAIDNPELSGIGGKQEKIQCVKDLRHSVRGELCKRLGVRHYSEAQELLAHVFGFQASNHHAQADINAGVYYMTDAARRQFKLHFAKGRAHTMVSVGDQMAPVPYDTDNEAAHSQMAGANILEFGAAPFVMGSQGNIYITGQDLMKGDFKHTSFMAGENVLAAGTMRCENGKIKWISAKSGHYQPTARHMVTLFERLRAHQVDLSKVKFYRIRMGASIQGTPDGEFEECNAMDFLKARGFPGSNPQDMFIPPAPAVARA